MRVYKSCLAFLAFGVFASFPHSSANASVSTDTPEEAPSFKDLKEHVVTYPLRQLHAMHQEDFKKIQQDVYRNLDPKCLTPGCKIRISVIYADNGVPRCRKISATGDTPVDDFYCEQAIWENVLSSFPAAKKELIYEFGSDMSNGGHHREIERKKASNFVKLHLIPARFAYSDILSPEEFIRTKKNVLHLSVKKLGDPRLEAFRQEWYPVWESPTSREKIEQKALAIKKKYAGFFS